MHEGNFSDLETIISFYQKCFFFHFTFENLKIQKNDNDFFVFFLQIINHYLKKIIEILLFHRSSFDLKCLILDN